jgi:hypothetical protein
LVCGVPQVSNGLFVACISGVVNGEQGDGRLDIITEEVHAYQKVE